MTERRYCDTGRVAEALTDIVDTTAPSDDDVTLAVHDAPVVMRGITLAEAKERNLTHEFNHVCSITYDGTSVELCFHESIVEGTLELTPAGPRAIDAQQATPPRVLAPALDPVIDAIEAEFDITAYDFVGVEAGSIATPGHFTDFEFTYEITSMDWF